ncbi:unnamed protein product [Dovyalis caffra]|uniref:40S ribosomal protein S24 n=1 Tax=Dovyalis caffra TaxID=77055 RepID=A0AAV1RND4_9ROSI|nr:unnamed protein product [Dovyalis caffra]
MTNHLLSRKQFIIDVLHPGKANVSKVELKEKLKNLYKVKDPNTIFIAELNEKLANLYEVKDPNTIFVLKLATKVEKSRKQLKERKNKAKKVHGVKKTKIEDAAKKKCVIEDFVMVFMCPYACMCVCVGGGVRIRVGVVALL